MSRHMKQSVKSDSIKQKHLPINMKEYMKYLIFSKILTLIEKISMIYMTYILKKKMI